MVLSRVRIPPEFPAAVFVSYFVVEKNLCVSGDTGLMRWYIFALEAEVSFLASEEKSSANNYQPRYTVVSFSCCIARWNMATKKTAQVTASPKAEVLETVGRVLSEDVLTLKEAREELQAICKMRVDKATICRWARRGCGGIRLETVRIGHALLTSRQALTRFIAARS